MVRPTAKKVWNFQERASNASNNGRSAVLAEGKTAATQGSRIEAPGVQKGSAVVAGSYCQNDLRFEAQFRNSQCTAMSVAALCHSDIMNPSSWNKSSIDRILVDGHRLYVNSLRALGPNANKWLTADEVLGEFCMAGHRFKVEYKDDPFQTLMPQVHLLLDDFFDKNNKKGVLTSGGLSVAILKVDNFFWVVDSHSRDGKSGQVSSDGVAVACKFENISSLASLLKQNLGSGSGSVVSICPVAVTKQVVEDVSPSSGVVSTTNQRSGVLGEMRNAAANDEGRVSPIITEYYGVQSRGSQSHLARVEMEVVNPNLEKKKQYMRKKRKDTEYKENEYDKNRKRNRSTRQNKGYELKEKNTNLERAAAYRQDDDYRTRENRNNLERAAVYRQDDDYRTRENRNNLERAAVYRQDDDYRTRENSNNLERTAVDRQDDDYRTRENRNNLERAAIYRQDDDYRTRENRNNLERAAIYRQDDDYRTRENSSNLERAAVYRQDDDYRRRENSNNLERAAIYRAHGEFRSRENACTQVRISNYRESGEYLENKRKAEAENKRKARCDNILKFRERFLREIKDDIDGDNDVTYQKPSLAFIKSRKQVPEFICKSCDGLFFKHSVVRFDEDRLGESLPPMVGVFQSNSSSWLCRSCHSAIVKGRTPKLAICNGFQFVPIPDCLKDLSALEERMCSPFIPFLQIKPLKHFALNAQLGARGSVVNIPVSINDMTKVLPRSFSDMCTIQVKLKRHVDHATDYMFETIRPKAVFDALQFLKNTPLYKKHNILIDFNFDQDADQIDFIVDSSDMPNVAPVCNFEVEMESELHQEEDRCDDGEEVLIVDRNQQLVDQIQIMAPGQGIRPVPWHQNPDLEQLSFPKIFAGHPVNLAKGISYADRVKSETRRKDRRACIPSRLLYMAKKKIELACTSNINTCLRKSKVGNLKARDVRNKETLDKMVLHDDGYHVLNQIRSSPSYWEQRKKELFSMIRQLGKPTFFLTLSAAENNWPELLQYLAKIHGLGNFSLKDALGLDQATKSSLVRDDPVSVARYFSHRVAELMKFLNVRGGLFSGYDLLDSYARAEFQARGSAHIHMFLWLKDAPLYSAETEDEVISFIDQFTCCHHDPENPFVTYLKHHHSQTCYKGNKGVKRCRFNFPLPVMEATKILHPLAADEKSDVVKNDFKKIQNFHQSLFQKDRDISFDDILATLNMSADQYVTALRSNISRSQVFLKRSSLEVSLNSYNPVILNLFESNIDMQFVLEEYGVASYIVNYISKVEAGLSKLLREASSDVAAGYTSVKEKLRTVANVFINGNLLSSQEAAYHCLSIPLSKSSRGFIYVNTSPISERVRMLKGKNNLDQLAEDSGDIFMNNVFEKYARRPRDLDSVCLADFAAFYTEDNRKASDDVNDDEEPGPEEERRGPRLRRRERPRILRYRRYKLIQDEVNYYREQILLFLPWRNEVVEVEDVVGSMKYEENRLEIDENRKKYCVLSDEKLDDAVNQVLIDQQDRNDAEIGEFEEDRVPEDQMVDILRQGGHKDRGRERDRDTSSGGTRFATPQRICFSECQELVRKLNDRQKEFVMHMLHCIKIGQAPFNLYLSGSAGVGKSTVINAIYQLVTHFYDNQAGPQRNDSIKVLLCAPSGKAAFLIGGVTLHTAFALPVQQFGGDMPELSNDLANSIREKLLNTKLVVIDEISMVGSALLAKVDTRLRQVMGRNEAFGGVSILVVGDLNQLPPVMDSPVFKFPKQNQFAGLFDNLNPLWEPFKFYELTQVMRQKDEILFIRALNNLAAGTMTEDDVSLVKSREVLSEEVVPREAIRLFALNKDVDNFNNKALNECPEVEHKVLAIDKVIGKVGEKVRERALESMKSKKVSEVGGLPHILRLKVGIKYMISSNVDVEDGLVNGSCGILRGITFSENGEVEKMWLDFGSSSNVGKKAKLKEQHEILPNLVPLAKKSITISGNKDRDYEILRLQFPAVPAEALTVHKSQGQSYDSIAVDLRQSKRITRPMLYVALSRVTSLRGLFILGVFRPPPSPKSDDPTAKEISRLKQDATLQLSFNNLQGIVGRVVCVYLNARSLRKNLEFIVSDAWYFRSSILLFSESNTLPADDIEIPGFTIFYRSDSTYTERKPRGVIGYLKMDNSDLSVLTSDVINGSNGVHVDLFAFKLRDVTVISGYKSPKTPNQYFVDRFNNILDTAKINRAIDKIVILGDFNFNVLELNFFSKMMADWGFSSQLAEEVTTDGNSQLDVIFSNFLLSPTGVYETYFSDHKPVFCCWSGPTTHEFNESL